MQLVYDFDTKFQTYCGDRQWCYKERFHGKNMQNLYILKTLTVLFLGNDVPEKARTYLQSHYGNGVFGNVYLIALDNTKR